MSPPRALRSLSARLLVVASVVLAAFLGLTGATLDNAFEESAAAAARERLLAQVYLLLAAAEVDEDGLRLPDGLAEGRYASPASGLYAEVRGARGEPLWRSASTLGSIPYPGPRRPGEPVFATVVSGDGTRALAVSFAVTWELASGEAREYTFHVGERASRLEAEVSRFRRSLWGWLAGAALVLVLLQWVILRWGLAPLRRVALEVREIEHGRRQALAGGYPSELERLTVSLNAFIADGRARLERYRKALADLAHSLKTPLAVLRNATEAKVPPEALRETVREQVERMDRTVAYQLQRAAASGRAPLGAPVAVRAVASRLADTLAKVYAERSIDFELAIGEDAVFRGDEGDLTEILGNLMDNACKWAAHRVRVGAAPTADGSALEIVVEDDGPGVAPEAAARMLERGARLDEQRPGHGIGLAIVREVVEELYGGSVTIEEGALGGARVRLRL